MMTPAQSRAARGLLGWTQAELAGAANVGVVTVRQFEGGNAEPRPATLTVIRAALEAAGVIFIAENGEGPGVRMRKEPRRVSTDDGNPPGRTTDPEEADRRRSR